MKLTSEYSNPAAGTGGYCASIYAARGVIQVNWVDTPGAASVVLGRCGGGTVYSVCGSPVVAVRGIGVLRDNASFEAAGVVSWLK